ncbi:hypothetical protein [Ralstonia phage vB_RsoP_BMB50]|uniref:Uncharacterized protein n=1 Tax=Ralstonia phage vB_RsoP_BMB50 TaxID=2834269 RepID=A0A8E5NW40_9CAUD|nr:hypothetical protein [Ralstonia phage vB_RsoP_BMB50]
MIEYKDIVAALGRVRANLEAADDEGDYVCLDLKEQLAYLFHATPGHSTYGQAGEALEKIGVFAKVQYFLREEARSNGREADNGDLVAEDACQNGGTYKEWQAEARAMRIKLVDQLIGVYS